MIPIRHYLLRCGPPLLQCVVTMVLMTWFGKRRTLTPIRQRSPWVVIVVNVCICWWMIIDAIMPIIMHLPNSTSDYDDIDNNGVNVMRPYSCWWSVWQWHMPVVIAYSAYQYRMINFMFAAAHAHHQMAIANEPSSAAHRRIAHPSCMVRYRRCQSSLSLALLVALIAASWIAIDVWMLLPSSPPCAFPGTGLPPTGGIAAVSIPFYLFLLLLTVGRFRLDDSFHIRVELTSLFVLHLLCGIAMMMCLWIVERPPPWHIDGYLDYLTWLSWIMVSGSSMSTLAWPLLQSYRMARLHKSNGQWNVATMQLPNATTTTVDENATAINIAAVAGPWYTIRDLASLLAIPEGMRSFRTFLVQEFNVELLGWSNHLSHIFLPLVVSLY
jgi:hypothetical protein